MNNNPKVRSTSDKWRNLISTACQTYTIDGTSELLGVRRATVSNWKNHGVLPDLPSLIHYCDILGVDITTLVADTPSQCDEHLPQRRDVISEVLALPINERKKLLVEVAKSL